MTQPATYTGPLWVAGHPVSKGSLKCVTPHVKGLFQNLQPADKRDPDGFVGKLPDVLAWQAQKVAADPIDEPVELRCEFYMARPTKTDFAAPVGHGIGDLDKLVRQVGDAVGGSKTNPARLITDDSRITRIVAEKLYAPDGKEGCRVELLPYTPPAAEPSGPMPVRIQAGRDSFHIGSITRPADLPALLRTVADQLERGR